MYQIDVSTAASTLPVSTAAGTPGYFTDGDLSKGLAPTIVPAEFLNALMLEVLNVLSGAGIAPSKTTNNQLLLAIRTLVGQIAASVAPIATTGGTTVLSVSQYGSAFIMVSGALAANATLVFPSQPQRWTVINNTTGPYSLTCQTAAGGGVTVTQGHGDTIVADGANIVFASYDVPLRPYGDSSNASASTMYVDRAVAQVGGYYQDVGTVANAYLVEVVAASDELVTNGTFDLDTSGWASSSSFASTATAIGGEMRVTTGASYGRQVQAIACIPGKTYILSGTLRAISGVGAMAFLGVSGVASGASMSTWAVPLSNSSSSAVTQSLTFVATASIMYIVAGEDAGTSTGWVLGFDNISVKQTNELVTNGQFKNDTTGWSSAASYPSTATATAGEMRVTPSVAFGRQIYAFPTTPGKTYFISASVRRVSGTSAASFGVCSANGSDIAVFDTPTSATFVTVAGTYTATATTTYIQAGTTGTTDVVAAFDNISVRQRPDHPVSFRFRTARPNTGAATIDFGQGFFALTTEQGAPLAGGDISTGSIVSVTYDPALGYAVINELVPSQFGAVAKENIGQGLEDDGTGNLRVKLADTSLRRTAGGVQSNDPILTVAASQAITGANHGGTLLVTGAAVTLTVPATSTLWNGYNVSVIAQGGPVNFAPNAADKVNNGTTGAAYTLQQGQSANFVCDGAGNWWPIFQTTVAGSYSPKYITASTSLGAGAYLVNTSGGAITVTLPSGPAIGAALEFTDAMGTWSVYPLTINPNGRTIFGSTDPLVFDVPGEDLMIWYDGTDWKAI